MIYKVLDCFCGVVYICVIFVLFIYNLYGLSIKYPHLSHMSTKRIIKLRLFRKSMIIDYLLYTLTFIVLFIGSYTDFKKREVADTVNYGFLFGILGIKLIYSINIAGYWYFIDGLAGAAIFFIFACMMFYTGQWGGGDSKMMMGLGALFGFSVFRWNEFQAIWLFLINALVIGAVYGFGYSVLMAIRHWHKFSERFAFHSKKQMLVKMISGIICALLLIISFFLDDFMLKLICYLLIFFFILSVYLYLFAKAVEESSMMKHVAVSELTEGDWIVDDVIVDGKRITGPKDLGIELKQIAELKMLEKLGKVDKILIKVGIPFVPSFMISFLVTVLFGNWLLLFIQGM